MNDAARIMIENGVNHLPVIGEAGKLAGIVTSWDIAKAVACGYQSLDQIISRHVFTATPEESIAKVVKLMEEKAISALPVVDDNNQLVGIVSSDSLSTLLGRCTNPKKHK
jgi:homoserine O-acetyltransferase